MELARLLKPLMELEYQMHRLYMWYSDMFYDDNGNHQFFRLMAREELKHKDSVQNQFQLVSGNLTGYEPVEADLEGLLQLTRLLKEQIDKREPMTLSDALVSAIQMEKSAAESHYRFLIARSNPLLRELIVELAKADKDHLARLELRLKSLQKA